MSIWSRCGLLLLSLALAPCASAETLYEGHVRAAMANVEALLKSRGIDVSGYGDADVPKVELVPASHPYLQGADGGYVDGHVYLNGEALATCTDLTLVHELVHDASIKRRLFSSVGNLEIRETLEALADEVTADAAQEPYRPGCLPRRRFARDPSELAEAANAEAANPEAPQPARVEGGAIVIPLFFTRGRLRLPPSAVALLTAVSCHALDRTAVTIALVEDDEILDKPKTSTLRRARAVRRALAKLGLDGERIALALDDGAARDRDQRATFAVAARSGSEGESVTEQGAGRGLVPR